jgi:hypothetical protein
MQNIIKIYCDDEIFELTQFEIITTISALNEMQEPTEIMNKLDVIALRRNGRLLQDLKI